VNCNFYFSLVRENRVYPSKVKSKVGDDVKYYCVSNKSVTWDFNGGPLDSNMLPLNHPQQSILHVLNVQKKDEGVFTCSGVKENFFKFTDGAILTVAGSRTLI